MRMILLCENELTTEAILLVAGPDRMRVIVGGAKDATELRLINDQWMTEEGDAVDIDSLIMRSEGLSQPCVRGNAA
jgi:hypothetical protein